MPQWFSEYFYSLSPAEFNLFTLVLFIACAYLINRIYQTHQRYRFIQDTATSRIASAAQGYSEIKGTAELLPESYIQSPFSKRKCVWFQCKVEVKKTSGKRNYWVEESNLISDEIFILRDDSGDCIVIPEQARVISSYHRVWHGSGLQAAHTAPETSSHFNFLAKGNYRFTESMIFVADPLYILGEFESIRKNPDEAAVKQQVEDLVQQWKIQPMRYLKPFDLDNNGKIQQQEWNRIRQHARTQVLQRYQQQQIHTIKKPRETSLPFLISTRSEQELLIKKRLSLVLYLMLFFIISSLLIYMITLSAK